MIPTAFGQYTVIKSLGSGGMADVYLAHDPTLGRQVAIKAPHREYFTGEGRARFAREARAAAALEHSAIVPIYDYAEQDGLPYMVMRCLTGGSLDQRIANRPLQPAEALTIIERIAAALDYAHSRGVIHRDVKSANILFDEHGAAYLSDFGIAWMATAGETSRLTSTGMVRGTFDYISPEQAQGVRDLDGRSDLYSLGVVLFEMLTGDVPYQADSAVSLAVQHISAPVPDIRARRPDLPPAFQNVIARALAKRPQDRYPNGAALVADLRRVAGGLPHAATPPPRPDAQTPGRTARPGTGGQQSSRNVIWLLGAVALVVAIAAFALTRPDDPASEVAAGGDRSATVDVVSVAEPPDGATGEPDPTIAPTSTTAAPAEDNTVTVGSGDGRSVIDKESVPVAVVGPEEIVFQSNRDGDFEIYVMDLDGRNQRQLTFNDTDDNYPRVSPDGRRILFVSERDGNSEIYVMNRDGREQTRLTNHSGDDNLPAWSPDGREIVFTSSRDGLMDVFIMNDDGSNVRQITDSPEREGHVSWSVHDELAYNGSMELYWQLWGSDADGANRHRITHSTYDEWSPEWSPDGEWLLFLSERDSRTNPGIYVMRPDGSDARLLYNGDGEEWGAAWSADGSQILFTAVQPGDRDDIFIMEADGRNVRLLTERGSYPSWAAAVPGNVTFSDLAYQHYEIEVSGTAGRTLTGLNLEPGERVIFEVVGGGWQAGPGTQWARVSGTGDSQVASKPAFPVPDRPVMTLVVGVGDGRPVAAGDYLDFTAQSAGELWLGPNDDNPADNDGALRVRLTRDMVTSRAGGGIDLGPATAPLADPQPLSGDDLVRLTFGEMSHYTAIFAPDQSRLLLSAETPNGWHVFEADPNGGGLGRQLTRGPYNHYQADLSPDGKTFLTSANLDGDGDIYLFDAATGEMLAQLTDNRGVDYHPRWLPDGSGFIYSVDDEGTANDEIFLARFGGQQTQLTDNGAFDGFATLSADGRWVAFYSGRDGDFEIYVMAIDGGDQRRLTTSSGRDASPSFSPDGRWVVFESDRGGRYEIYAVPFEGGEVTRLTDSDGDNYFPVISPDGQWLMFQSTRAGEMDIYRQPWEK